MGSGARSKPSGPVTTAGTDSNTHHAQLLAQSFSMDLDNLDNPSEEPKTKITKEELFEGRCKPVKSGKFVNREFHATLKERLTNRQDLGEAMADTVRLGEGPHWKQRYYFEKFKVKQDDLVDFLQRIRKAYIEGLAVLLPGVCFMDLVLSVPLCSLCFRSHWMFHAEVRRQELLPVWKTFHAVSAVDECAASSECRR